MNNYDIRNILKRSFITLIGVAVSTETRVGHICVSTRRKGPVVSKDQNWLFDISLMAVLSSQFWCKNF